MLVVRLTAPEIHCMVRLASPSQQRGEGYSTHGQVMYSPCMQRFLIPVVMLAEKFPLMHVGVDTSLHGDER